MWAGLNKINLASRKTVLQSGNRGWKMSKKVFDVSRSSKI